MLPSRIRVVDLETTGSQPPAHGVCEVGWQDVTLGADGRWAVAGDRGGILVNPGRLIPPVTMAVHHITDDDVADAEPWRAVAPRVLKPEDGVLALAAHRASFEQRFCTPELAGGAAWICTWKCALRLWPGAPAFSNQVLRYWRRPHGLDRDTGLPVHRAFPDAYVTAHHLRDMLNAASVAQLIAWSAEPGLLPRVGYGPNRGAHWDELDLATLQRLAEDRNEDTRFTARTELARRGQGEAVPTPTPAQAALL